MVYEESMREQANGDSRGRVIHFAPAGAVLTLLAVHCARGSLQVAPPDTTAPVAEATPARSASSAVAPVPSAVDDAPALQPASCDALQVGRAVQRTWWKAALAEYLAKQADRDPSSTAAAREVLAALQEDRPLPDFALASMDCQGAPGMGIVSLSEPNLELPGSVPSEVVPRAGPRGCWSLIRTGVQSITHDPWAIYHAYAVAFAGLDGAVSTFPVPAYFEGVDFINVLAVADLDGDGWEEGLYLARNGWAGQMHDDIGGQTTLLLTSKGGTLSLVTPFDDAAMQHLPWDLRDANGDGRYDLVEDRGWVREGYCARDVNDHFGDPPYVHNPFALAQSPQGRFSYENEASKAFLRARCPKNPSRLQSSEDVLCARIHGECTTDLARRIRGTNSPFQCTLEALGRPQPRGDANKEYHDMLANAAVFRPPASLAPVCDH